MRSLAFDSRFRYYAVMIYAPIENAPLERHLAGLEEDGVHIFIAGGGLFRGALFHGTRFVNRMRAQHRLGILETMALGQASLCAALMIQTMSGCESLQLRYETDGPAVGFSVDADSMGFVRGYLLQNPIPITAPLESWELASFFGNGTISVTRFPQGVHGEKRAVQQGITEIKYRNIAKDLAWYFQQSEHLHTAFNIDIHFDTNGDVTGAGGLFIQRMMTPERHSFHNIAPRSEEETDELIVRMERAFSSCPPLGGWFSEGGNCEDIIFGLLREFDPQAIAVRNIVFDCPCSPGYYLKAIRKLPEKELKRLKETSDDPLELICRNCSSVYHIPLSEI